VSLATAMRSAPMPPQHVLGVQNELGEGILWDPRHQCLWWTDIPRCRLHRYDWSGGSVEVFETPERLASFGLVAGSDRLIAAFASGVALYSPHTGAIDWLARPPEAGAGVRFNDGRVDRAGRFWTGTMVEDGRDSADAHLYSIGAGAGLRRHLSGLRISNSLCTSPDGSLLYFADSPTRTIRAFALAEPAGDLGADRIFATTPQGSDPDGATVDREGCLWSAHWGGGCVTRYTPGGSVERVLRVPASQPSCACLAGPALDVLCVTSARADLDAGTLRDEPHAGDVFFYQVGVQGLPEAEFRP